MNTYTSMQLHIDRHAYKRGANKGEAPLDGFRRSRNHERVRKTAAGNMAVRFHNTDVITVQPDGSFVLSCDGWFRSPTTRTCMNDAFHKFGIPARVYNETLFSKHQPIVRVGGKEYRYYDGISFSSSGELLSQLKPFEAKRIDRSATKELHDGIKESGFRDAFKLLHATTTPEHESVDPSLKGTRRYPEWLRDVLTDKDCADMWPGIVRQFAFKNDYDLRSRGWVHVKRDAKNTWTDIMYVAKGDLYETVIAPTK